MPKITLNELIIPKYDDVLFDILDHKHTHYTLLGGRGGTKSSFIPTAEILLMTQPQNREVHAASFRKVGNTLAKSCYNQTKKAVNRLKMSHLWRFTKSPLEATYIPTGQKIYFIGLDDPDKVKSITPEFGYIGITHFEELDQYHGREEVSEVLRSTMRGQGVGFWNFESFNPPISASNWANKDLLIERDDRLIVKTSYLDVPVEWLSQGFIDEAEQLKKINEKAYRHAYLGDAVGTGGQIFENVTIRKMEDKDLATFDRMYYGNDWGWYPDCNHFSEMYFNAAQRKLYIFGEIRCWKTKNEKYAEMLDRWRNVKIVADSQENKSIADFQSWGFNMYGAIKGPGSVDYSMKWLQSLSEIIIDNKRCPHTAEEFLTYEYEKTKNGEIISGYPDKNNHSIDSIRYALEEVWRRRGQ